MAYAYENKGDISISNKTLLTVNGDNYIVSVSDLKSLHKQISKILDK